MRAPATPFKKAASRLQTCIDAEGSDLICSYGISTGSSCALGKRLSTGPAPKTYKPPTLNPKTLNCEWGLRGLGLKV